MAAWFYRAQGLVCTIDPIRMIVPEELEMATSFRLMIRLEILGTAVWSVWAIRLASLGALNRSTSWIPAVTGLLLALTWAALLGVVVFLRIRPARVDLWVLGLCPVVWVIAVGAMVWTDLDLLKKVPLINRLNWERVIGNTAVWPVNRTPSVHEQYVQQARAADTVDILWVGDSNTSDWRTGGSEVWKREYRELRCLNFGIRGDRTQDILWRLEHGELEGPEPRVVALEVGANNLSRNTVEEIACAIRAIVAVIRGRRPGAMIIVIAIQPRGTHLNAPINTKIRAINTRLAALDDGARVRVLDITHRLADALGDLRVALLNDGIHLSPQGYRIWAEAMRPLLAESIDGRK
jgi:lysophospholipase L1-like esterase